MIRSASDILADTWYAATIPNAARLSDRVPEHLRPLIQRSGVARGLAMLIAGRRADVVVTSNAAPGALLCAVAYGVIGHRKLVLLEYIVHQAERRDYGRRAWFFVLRRWLLRRALLCAHVLTHDEARICAAQHKLPIERFQVVHWPSRLDDSPMPPLNDGRRVVATGRRTDWTTFFAAADGTDWEVRAVCTAADLPLVTRLAGPEAVIRHDISSDEHQLEVNQATVYVIPVPETGASIGQIRVMNATQAGVPMVASDVAGLRGYLDESCAVLVSPGDPTALRRAVNALLDDRNRRAELRSAARKRGGTMDDYLERINTLINATRGHR
jgi:glycosyltransferase involved in cell wall biosynthesis